MTTKQIQKAGVALRRKRKRGAAKKQPRRNTAYLMYQNHKQTEWKRLHPRPEAVRPRARVRAPAASSQFQSSTRWQELRNVQKKGCQDLEARCASAYIPACPMQCQVFESTGAAGTKSGAGAAAAIGYSRGLHSSAGYWQSGQPRQYPGSGHDSRTFFSCIVQRAKPVPRAK